MVRVAEDIDQWSKNYTALTPLWFLERAAQVHPTRDSLLHGSRRYTWHQTYQLLPETLTGGAPPPPSVLSGMSERGFRVTHVYGLSEVYGPAVYCSWKPEWESLPPETQARLHARQGVRYIGLEYLDVVNAKTMQPVPADGKTCW
ncbi:hypothetical protein JHK87_019589 [Glycine soja]|nr:hypothetical protein JHK87_019589 [Glycine soja]